MDVEVPECLTEPLIVPNILMMGAGPSNCSPRVLRAASLPIIGPVNPDIFKLLEEIKEGIKYIFQTKNPLTLCISGAAHAAMEACLVNLLEPGSKALFAHAGFWSLRAADMASRCGATSIIIDVQLGKTFSFWELEMALQKHKPDVLFITHTESATGVLQELEGLGEICQRYNCLLIVDAVASCGASPLFMDRWKIDVLFTGSQKALGTPAGISPISFSSRAQERIFSRKTPISSFYFDMKLLGQYWGCYDNKPQIYHHTVSASLLYALREGLAQICEETLEKVWERHEKCSKLLTQGLEDLGLELFVEKEEDRCPDIITVTVPKGVDWRKVISYTREKLPRPMSMSAWFPGWNRVVGFFIANVSSPLVRDFIRAAPWNEQKQLCSFHGAALMKSFTREDETLAMKKPTTRFQPGNQADMWASIEISVGIGEIAEKTFRIGVMGYNATPKSVEKTLAALKEALKAGRITNKLGRIENNNM